MPLIFILVILFAILYGFRISTLYFVKPFSLKMHNLCLDLIPKESHSYQELAALVCGQNFLTAENSYFYSSTGLIHLFVVSGAHLVLLDAILKKLFIKSAQPRLFFLIVYCGICEFNPPVVRSWLILFFTNMIIFNRKNCSKSHLLFFVGMICLCLNPSWLMSLSLQLSWLIALAILINQQVFPKNTILLHQFSYYFVVLPSIASIQSYSPYSVLLNILLAPVLEFVLFPLALLTTLINFIYPVFDYLISILRQILKFTELQSFLAGSIENQYVHLINWSLIFLIHLFLHFQFIYKQRKSYV